MERVDDTARDSQNACMKGDPHDEDEEGIDSYHPGGFHPVRLGELYDGKYRVLRKLGFGQYSTVWLVRNEETATHWAMKVLSAECYGTDNDIYELEILKHLKASSSDHQGANYVTMLEHSFEHQGPNGKHVCLVFKLMAESLLTFADWFDDRRIPAPLVQHFTIQLLKAVDFAHACGVVHTDIKQSNIMVQIPDEALLMASLGESDHQSQALHDDTAGNLNAEDDDHYTIIPTKGLRDDYFEEGFNFMELDIALSDWGVATWFDKNLSELIQPVLLRAPEVVLEAPWNQAVDIWNLGALVPELIFGQCMFDGRATGQYLIKSHLEEMNALLGSFPRTFFCKAGLQEAKGWFDADGNISTPATQRVVSLERRFADLEVEGRKFLDFVKALLALDPNKRPSARNVLDTDSWINHEYEEDEDSENEEDQRSECRDEA